MSDRLVTRLIPFLAKPQKREFNVFDVLRYGGYEKQLSDVFAWLLKADGTHEIGDAFLRIFIDEVNRGLPPAEPITFGVFAVAQEVDTCGPGGVADVVLSDDKAVVVVENYWTSDGHGHDYQGYWEWAARGGKRPIVVLLCDDVARGRQTEGWEKAVVVTYASLLSKLVESIETLRGYRFSYPDQWSFINQMHQRYRKDLSMSDSELIDFVAAVCKSGASRYGERNQELAASTFVEDLRQQAVRNFNEGRRLQSRLKRVLKDYGANVLKPAINAALGKDFVVNVGANHVGNYEWTVWFKVASPTVDGDNAFYLKWGHSAWFINERDSWTKKGVTPDEADYTHLFVCYDGETIQSAVTLGEVLAGLKPEDTRLLDEVVRLVKTRASEKG